MTRKAYRQEAAWATYQAGFRTVAWPRAHLVVTFCPPDERKRDLDNMLAAIKSGLDGIADAIGMDDSRWEITMRRGACKRPDGAVLIEFGAVIERDFVPFRGTINV
jgi:crossover junction endodeoxyribonuclease RusA